MKEEFDLSHYLNTPNRNTGTQILSEVVTKTISANKETERVDLSEPSERSNHSALSEQEKQQAVSSIPRRISHKQLQENLESYREAFLTPHKIINRKATYLSRSTRERLEFVVRRLGDYGANVSSFLECIALRHLEEYSKDIERWRKL